MSTEFNSRLTESRGQCASDVQTLLAQLTPWQITDTRQRHAHRLQGYQRSGHGTPLHFLHGNGFCGLTLSGVAASLPPEWPLWFTDVPGHGGSDQPRHRMPDWQAMAESVATALTANLAQAKQTGPVIGVGHSMGGVMTLLAAARHPQLFERIILLDPVLFSPEIILGQHVMRATGAWKRSALVRSVSKRRRSWPGAQQMRDELASKGLYRQWQPEVLDAFVEYGSEEHGGERRLCCDPRWEGAIFGSYPRGLWHAVRKVSVPVDILVAENSYGFIEKSARRAARINPHIRWQRFGKTHCFPMEQPLETADKLQQLLSQSR